MEKAQNSSQEDQEESIVGPPATKETELLDNVIALTKENGELKLEIEILKSIILVQDAELKELDARGKEDEKNVRPMTAPAQPNRAQRLSVIRNWGTDQPAKQSDDPLTIVTPSVPTETLSSETVIELTPESAMSDELSSPTPTMVESGTNTPVLDIQDKEAPNKTVMEATLTPANPKDSKMDPALYDMAIDIIHGLNKTLSMDFGNSGITRGDFTYCKRVVSRSQGRRLLFKECAPKVSHVVRKTFGVTEADIKSSFRIENVKGSKGEGKSGAFILYTKDHRFVLKTATKSERDFFWKTFLPSYIQYIKKNEDTLLLRILGVCSMKYTSYKSTQYFIITNNIFNSNIYYDPIEIYDLKGSKVGRSVPENERTPGKTLKDLDIQRKLYIPDKVATNLLKQFQSDANFLAQNRVMDYSLLVGIHYHTNENAQAIKSRKENEEKRPPKERDNMFRPNSFQIAEGGIISHNPLHNRNEYYYLGIIDILQVYNSKKRIEHFLKSFDRNINNEELSVVDPVIYANRFCNFIGSQIIEVIRTEDGKIG